MIIWIASYPKSGNTYIRSFLSAYFFTNTGNFDFKLLKNIEQFPDKQFFNGFIDNIDDASKSWLSIQKDLIKSNKTRFLKTHSAFISFNNNQFTNAETTLGSVYIVRDPRSIVTSIMNHFSMDQFEAAEMLFDEDRGIKSSDGNLATYSFLSSWCNHYNSWNNLKTIKSILIKYEDLEKSNEEIFSNLIRYINNLIGSNEGIDHQKFIKALETTKFSFLKKKEGEEGFVESVYSKSKDHKIPFFNQGFKNDWENVLEKKVLDKIEKKFYKEMKLLGYLD
tara:strand:+ start:1753 stop:2589 length:837 start_codon:yes stop_codon:yes gene_type:complete